VKGILYLQGFLNGLQDVGPPSNDKIHKSLIFKVKLSKGEYHADQMQKLMELMPFVRWLAFASSVTLMS
jgi:hypothetical protein